MDLGTVFVGDDVAPGGPGVSPQHHAVLEDAPADGCAGLGHLGCFETLGSQEGIPEKAERGLEKDAVVDISPFSYHLEQFSNENPSCWGSLRTVEAMIRTGRGSGRRQRGRGEGSCDRRGDWRWR